MNKYDTNPHRYDDIIHLKYPYKTSRKKMSLNMRGAQFAPFAALTGHDASVKETARLTDTRIELNEQQKSIVDMKLSYLSSIISQLPKISVVYFEEDLKKEGGAYRNKEGSLKKIDEYTKRLIFEDKSYIYISDIYTIESDLFENLNF